MPNPSALEAEADLHEPPYGMALSGSHVSEVMVGHEIMLSAAACQQELLSSCMQRLQSAEDAISYVRGSLRQLSSEMGSAFAPHSMESGFDASHVAPQVKLQVNGTVFDTLKSAQAPRSPTGWQGMEANSMLRKEAAAVATVAAAAHLDSPKAREAKAAHLSFLTDPLPLRNKPLQIEERAPAAAAASLSRTRFTLDTGNETTPTLTISNEGEFQSLPTSGRHVGKIATKQSSNMGDSAKSWHAMDAMAKQTSSVVDQVVVDALDTEDRRTMKTLIVHSAVAGGSTASMMSNASDSQAAFQGSADVVWVDIACGLRIPTLNPEGTVKLWWLTIGFIFISFEVYWVPFALSFEVDPTGLFLWFISLINAYWLTDILLNFITGYHDHEGFLERSLTRIGSKYVRGMFFLDLVAGIPWEWIPDTGAARLTRSIRIVRTMRLLRLARLLRLMKLKNFMEQAEGIIEDNSLMIFFLGVLRVLFALYGITHWAACIWYVVGSGYEAGESSWLHHDLLTGVQIKEDPVTVYVYSLYFTLTTMTTVGYGDITASRFPEVVFVLALLCVASVVFAGLMGVLMDLITQLNAGSHLKQEKKTELSRYMKWRDVPAPLAKLIREHLVFLWDTNGSYDEYEADIKSQLPPVLKTDLCHHVYGRVLYSAPFLAWMKSFGPCVKKLSESVYSVFLVGGDQLFRIGEPCASIHFLITGSVHLSRNESVHGKGVPVLPTNPEEDMNHSLMMAFSIPRNQASGVEDIRRSMKEKAKKVRDLNYTRMAQAEGVLSKFHLTHEKARTAKEARRDEADGEAEEESKAKKRQRRRNYDIFESDVFRDATLELMRLDMRRKSAAAIVQKAWRGRIKKRDGRSHTKSQLSVSRLQSKTMQAPAYFGESCLWVPYDEWGSENNVVFYQYSAVCDSRLTSEIVHIPRTAISEVIEAYSPWLLERFEIFQGSVLRGLSGAMGNKSSTASVVDWAVIDLGPPPQDEATLGREHFESLRRSSQAQRLPPTVPKLRGLSPRQSPESRTQLQQDKKEGSTSSTRPSPREKDKNGISGISTYRRLTPVESNRRPSAFSARGGLGSGRLQRYGAR